VVRLIASLAALHWLFQRACILTTPFWSGFRGFRVKLWLVEPRRKDYLGIYEWAGRANAERYARMLLCVLRPLSTAGSVWYEIHDREPFARYLQAHAASRGAST
jgi:hypothetical protein